MCTVRMTMGTGGLKRRLAPVSQSCYCHLTRERGGNRRRLTLTHFETIWHTPCFLYIPGENKNTLAQGAVTERSQLGLVKVRKAQRTAFKASVLSL